MSRLRVALFGSSSTFSGKALDELAAAHEVVAVVRPASPGLGSALRRVARLEERPALEERAHALGIPIISAPVFDDTFEAGLRALRPDLVCIALFPRRVPDAITSMAPLGAINAHPSLLPRHRGPLPLFWTYHANDPVAGVTIHHASDRFDAGDIVLQESFGLPRGYPVASLDVDTAERAARLLRRSADALADGTATREPQDESRVTHAPLIRRGEPMAPFARWGVERSWHFLAGLCGQYREPLTDERGSPVGYARVIGFRHGTVELPPGSVRRDGAGWLLHCLDGVVELA